MNGIELSLQVIPLGLAAAVTPALIALQLLVMCGDRWLPRGLLIVAANALAFGIVIALLALGFAQLPDAHTGTRTGLDALRFGCGLVLLVMAVYFLLPHPGLNARTQAALEKRAAHARGWMFFALGFYFCITDVSSFVVIAPGLHDVTVSKAALVAKVGAVIVLIALSLLGSAGPLLMRVVLGPRATPALTRAYSWIMRNSLRVVGVILAGVGLWFSIGALVAW